MEFVISIKPRRIKRAGYAAGKGEKFGFEYGQERDHLGDR
jgi:hypothetical protein